MADTMTNEQIAAEFAELFGGAQETDEEPADTEETDDTAEDETVEETDDTAEETSDEEEGQDEEDNADDNVDTESEPSGKDSVTSKQSKQNHAFAELRTQNKQNEQFIRSLGKLVGLDNKSSVDDIKDKIKEVLIAKEAKDNNISIDLARRLDAYESDREELAKVKLEKKVQEDFSDLIDRHNLSDEDVQEFTTHLIEHGKNPMLDQSVDIEAEYLKLHYNDMVESAVQAALAKEEARKKKIDEKAPSPAPKGAGDKGESKISTVKDLDKLFDEMEL